MKRLEGRNAVVTGAASGVGRATSLLFAREGAAVACVDIDTDMGEETAEMIRNEGGEAIFIETDLANPAAIEKMAIACMEWCSVIHVLFNNAGIAERAEFEDIGLDDWNSQIAVNLTAPFLCSQKLLPGLKAANSASIIHHGSIDGVLGNPTLVAVGGLLGLQGGIATVDPCHGILAGAARHSRELH